LMFVCSTDDEVCASEKKMDVRNQAKETTSKTITIKRNAYIAYRIIDDDAPVVSVR